jgi:hypothetical protein
MRSIKLDERIGSSSRKLQPFSDQQVTKVFRAVVAAVIRFIEIPPDRPVVTRPIGPDGLLRYFCPTPQAGEAISHETKKSSLTWRKAPILQP